MSESPFFNIKVYSCRECPYKAYWPTGMRYYCSKVLALRIDEPVAMYEQNKEGLTTCQMLNK
ncbi:MAG: hypothetical protein ACK4XK_14175 [Casimicrobiaceae bacterium]